MSRLAALHLFRRQEQMDVVGHHVGVQQHNRNSQHALKVMQIEEIIIFGIKADCAVIAALDDVPGNARKAEAGGTALGFCS